MRRRARAAGAGQTSQGQPEPTSRLRNPSPEPAADLRILLPCGLAAALTRRSGSHESVPLAVGDRPSTHEAFRTRVGGGITQLWLLRQDRQARYDGLIARRWQFSRRTN
jgi:hypothetical protein